MQTEPAPSNTEKTTLPGVLTESPVLVRGIEALKEWFELSNVSLLYDSMVDPFTGVGLLNKVVAKKNVAFIVFTSEGDIFGAFYTQPIPQGNRDTRTYALMFSFECHGRCETPRLFRPTSDLRGGIQLIFSDTDEYVFRLSVRFTGNITIANEHSPSSGNCMSFAFPEMEETTLTGKNSKEPFTCTRLIALQLSD